MQPKSKGHSQSQLGGRALSSSGRRAHISLSANPEAALGRRGDQENRPKGQAFRGGLKGLQEVVPKEPPGHVRDTHLFTLSRPGRAAVPCKFGIGPPGPRSPPTLRSPACGLRCRGAGRRLRVGAAAVAASADRPAGVSALAFAGTSGRETAAGRELSPAGAAAPPPGCCSAARRRPLLGPGPGSSRDAASLPRERDTSALCVLRPGAAFPFPCSVPGL